MNWKREKNFDGSVEYKSHNAAIWRNDKGRWEGNFVDSYGKLREIIFKPSSKNFHEAKAVAEKIICADAEAMIIILKKRINGIRKSIKKEK